MSSAIRFVAPMMPTGATALSVEMSNYLVHSKGARGLRNLLRAHTLVLAAAKGLSSISDTCLQAAGMQDDLRTMPTEYLSKQSCIADITDYQVTETPSIHSIEIQRKLVQPRLRDIQQEQMLD